MIQPAPRLVPGRAATPTVAAVSLALIVGAMLIGCGANYVTRGADLYAGGHYIEAAEVFERTERRLPAASNADRARYGLYRGATLLALGDTMRAGTWLGYSNAIIGSDPNALSDEERTMLGQALHLIASRQSNGPQPPATSGATLAARPTATEAAAVEGPVEIGN